MTKALEKKSGIAWEKAKFFINRTLVYFSFLLLPVWIPKLIQINLFTQFLMLMAYLLFMAGQWYLLGKEIDHRLKIYFRANSTVDRVLYRLIIGHAVMLLIFNLMSLLSEDVVRHFFWGFFVVLGLFYSWPTRGKIIEESVSTQFTEYKYLDAFEKTVLFLSLAIFIFSFPNFPFLNNLETFKLVVDPEEKMNVQLWNFLQMNFFPFQRFPHLMNLGWSMHFYFIHFMYYLLSFYGILRFFISRRLSILGIFALISTWSFSIFLKNDLFTCASTTFGIVWAWSLLWSLKSATYRSGLMYGLLCYMGVSLNYNYFFLFPIGLLLLYFWFFKDSTDWYRNQFVKYTSLGFLLIVFTLITHVDLRFFEHAMSLKQLETYLLVLIRRKSFYALSFIGLLTLVMLMKQKRFKWLSGLNIDFMRVRELGAVALILVILGLVFDRDYIRSFGMLWFIVFLSILPLEWIFYSLNRLRSRRNMIYMIYVLVCLLDSHFEGRVRIVYNFFQSPLDIVDYLSR